MDVAQRINIQRSLGHVVGMEGNSSVGQDFSARVREGWWGGRPCLILEEPNNGNYFNDLYTKIYQKVQIRKVFKIFNVSASVINRNYIFSETNWIEFEFETRISRGNLLAMTFNSKFSEEEN